MKKIYIVGIALIVLILASSTVSAGFLDGMFGGEEKGTPSQFKVYATNPESVESQIALMEDDMDFYDNNTEILDWFKSLDGYVMLDTGHEYLVMERSEANSLPVVDDYYDNGKYQCNVINCTVLETHPLGAGLKDCLLVKNVTLVGNDTVTI